MKKIISQIIFVLILATLSFAQNEDQEMILFDEQQDVPLNSILYSMGGLVYEMSQNKDLKFQVNIFGGKGAEYFSTPYIYNAYISTQLKINWQIPAEKILVQNCNVHKEELRIRVFKVPRNVKFEPCEENLIVPSKSVLFETLYFYPTKTTLYEKAIEETVVDLYTLESQYSKTSLGVLENLLETNPKSKVYLISYLGKSTESVETKDENAKLKYDQIETPDIKEQGKKILDNIQGILERNGIKSSWIKAIEGGYQNKQRYVEIWFVPKGGEIPKPKPDYFPKNKK